MNMVCYKKSQAHGEGRGGRSDQGVCCLLWGCVAIMLGQKEVDAKVIQFFRPFPVTFCFFVSVAQLVVCCTSNTKVVSSIPMEYES